MNERTKDDYDHERQALDAAHAQNETNRDMFVALSHTALFAASVSFIGNVAPIRNAIWKPALLSGWTADVVGLLALTLSFGAARRAIDARRRALNDAEEPETWFAEALNSISLWSFPLALLCLFSFVTANVVHADDRPKNASISIPDLRAGRSHATSKSAQLPGARSGAAASCADLQRSAHAMDGRNPGAACASSTPATCTTASDKKMIVSCREVLVAKGVL